MTAAVAKIDPRQSYDAATTTKVETLAEAIESLVVAAVVLSKPGSKERHFKDLASARESVADAIRDVLRPTLRAVTTHTPSRLSQ